MSHFISGLWYTNKGSQLNLQKLKYVDQLIFFFQCQSFKLHDYNCFILGLWQQWSAATAVSFVYKNWNRCIFQETPTQVGDLEKKKKEKQTKCDTCLATFKSEVLYRLCVIKIRGFYSNTAVTIKIFLFYATMIIIHKSVVKQLFNFAVQKAI